MTTVVALLLVLAVVWFVVSPLAQAGSEADAVDSTRGELWRREKAVAVLAITEADFDRATGKLSDDDYRVLRTDYEGRALVAMDEIDRLAAPPVGEEAAGFCGGCGAPLAAADAFCGRCGRPRPTE
jgi:hypothetical protein